MAAAGLEHEHVYAPSPPALHESQPPLAKANGDASLDPSSRSAVAAASSASLEAIKDVVFGSLAGVSGKFIEYPFDTIKVRLQSHVPSPTSPAYRGPLDCFVRSYRYDGGFSSLYRGISAPLFGAAIETSSLFFSYRITQDGLVWAMPSLRGDTKEGEKVQLPMSALLFCGAASGAITSLLLTPIELVKCRMQVPAMATSLGYKPPGPLSMVGTIFRNEGVLGFWHGQMGTLIRETGGSAAWFGSYEAVCHAFRKYSQKPVDDNAQLPVYQQMLAGAAGGMAYNFIFYPADTIKSRMQTQDFSSSVKVEMKRPTFLSTGKDIWRDHGLKGFYRGCGITVARAAPSSAFIFAVYEGLRARFG